MSTDHRLGRPVSCCRNFLTADQHRAARDAAFRAWREVVSVASAP